jgi:tetratricopeptide (TPR) repeat protein
MFRNVVKKVFTQTLHKNSFFLKRNYHYFSSDQEEQVFLYDWNRTTEISRRFIAINQDPAMCAEVAIYQGHSYKAYGDYDTAIARYSLAINMDRSYQDRAKEGIEDCKRLKKENAGENYNDQTELTTEKRNRLSP